MSRREWWELYEDLKDASTQYPELRRDVISLRDQLALAELDLRSGGWRGYVRAGWSRDYFAMGLRAHTYRPNKRMGDLHNLRSLADLVGRFTEVRDAYPPAVSEWSAFVLRDGGVLVDAEFLAGVSREEWGQVALMLDPTTWTPPADVTLEDLTRNPRHALYRLRTYADKRVAHLAAGAVHTYSGGVPLARETILWHAATYVGLDEMTAGVDLLEEAVGNLDLFFGPAEP